MFNCHENNIITHTQKILMVLKRGFIILYFFFFLMILGWNITREFSWHLLISGFNASLAAVFQADSFRVEHVYSGYCWWFVKLKSSQRHSALIKTWWDIIINKPRFISLRRCSSYREITCFTLHFHDN